VGGSPCLLLIYCEICGLYGGLGGITINGWLWWCIASKNSNYSSFCERFMNLSLKGQFVFLV